MSSNITKSVSHGLELANQALDKEIEIEIDVDKVMTATKTIANKTIEHSKVHILDIHSVLTLFIIDYHREVGRRCRPEYEIGRRGRQNRHQRRGRAVRGDRGGLEGNLLSFFGSHLLNH